MNQITISNIKRRPSEISKEIELISMVVSDGVNKRKLKAIPFKRGMTDAELAMWANSVEQL